MSPDEVGSGQDIFQVLRMKVLATADSTKGAFELVEDVREEEQGPAPHIHRQSDEAFYVVEGLFTFTRGNEEFDAAAGSFIFIPRSTRHAYRARSSGSRLIILYVPAGAFVAFLRELDGLLAGGMTSASAMAALKGKYDSDPA